MNEHQDDIDIDRNLKILWESKSTTQFDMTNFINKHGLQMYSSNESKKFAELMIREGLIRVFGDFCALEKFGDKVCKSGGWLKYLSDKEKQESELESKIQEKELLDTEIKLLQKGELEYKETIREQKDRIRNLTEDLKLMSLIKQYWWFIGTCIGIGIFLRELLEKLNIIS